MNTTTFKLHFTQDLSDVMPKIKSMMEEIQDLCHLRLDIDKQTLNSLYLSIPDNKWNIWKGDIPQDTLQQRDFRYAQGEISIQELLSGNQRLVDTIQDTLRDFSNAFSSITAQAVDYAARKADIVFNKDNIDERLADKTQDSPLSPQLDSLRVLYTNIIRQLDNIGNKPSFNPSEPVYQALEQLRASLFHTIRELDNVITGQQLGMTDSQEMFWRIAAAQGAYQGESIEEAAKGEMGLSYDDLIEAAKDIEKQIKQLPATDIKGIARLSATLDNLNQRIDFLGAALHLSDEPFHRQTRINQAAKIIQTASQPQYKPDDLSDTHTIADLQKAVDFYKKQMLSANAGDLQRLQDLAGRFASKAEAFKGIAGLSQLKEEINQLQQLKGVKLKVAVDDIGISQISDKIANLYGILQYGGDDILPQQKKQIQDMISQWQKYAKVAKTSALSFRKTWQGIEGIGDGIERIDNLCKGGASSWQIFTGIVDSAIQIFDGFAAVIQIIQTISALTKAATAENVTQAAVNTAAAKTQAVAERELAASEFMAAHAYIPFAGAGIASGFIAQMQAVIASVAATPFANGGLVYGPTLALMGEYTGARSNPEVIAPLSKLQQLIAGKGHYVEVIADNRVVKSRVRGQDLELVLANTTRLHHRNSKIRLK